SGEGPSLVEAVCYRLTAHSSDDDHRLYRDAEELEAERKNDPIPKFAAYLKEVGVLDDALEKEMDDRIKAIVNEATDYAEKAPYAEPEYALRHVYKEEGGDQ